MSRKLTPIVVFAGAALVGAICLSPVNAKEWEESSPYYEDDAWYDISEWLDGNDYNPTDEVIGQWDDEIYGSAVADNDSDGNESDYGFDNADTDDDWFYDYYGYDYGNYDGLSDQDYYTSSSRYYDYDDDGFYDAFSSYADTDGDGVFDDFDYYSLTGIQDLGDGNQSSKESSSADSNGGQSDRREQAASRQADLSSKRLTVTGTIERTKEVKVPKGPVRLVAEVKGEDDQSFLVDLGPVNQYVVKRDDSEQNQSADQNDTQHASSGEQQSSEAHGPQVVRQGEEIVAHGPAIKVGDKKLILAQTAKIGDWNQREILRAGSTVNGTIKKLKSAEVRGVEHQLAILDLKSGKQALVDLGQKENLPANLAEGDEIQVTGIPTKIKDRLVFIANSISKDGDKTKIHRMTASADSRSSTASVR